MNARKLLEQYWPIAWFGGDALLFVFAILLWKPGTRGIAALLFIFALIPPLAFLGVLLEPSADR